MTVDGLDDFADVLDSERRAVWDTVAAAARACNGRLMGGTALALRLRHRPSTDFDIFTTDDFYHPAVVAILKESDHTYEPYLVRHNSVNVELGGVMVQILRDFPDRNDAGATTVQPIAEAADIHGMPVASLQDVFASKLNAIRHRSTQRDLIDIHHVDTTTWCKLDDGIRLHRMRYAIDAQDQILDGLARLLDRHDDGTLDIEGAALSPRQTTDAAVWLQRRLPEVSEVVAQGRAGAAVPGPSAAPPQPRSVPRQPRRPPRSPPPKS